MATPQTPSSKERKAALPSSTTQEQQSLDTFQHHVAAFQAADLDGVLADFADDAIVFTPDGVFEGQQQIRTVYAALFEEFGCIVDGDSPGILLDAMHVRDDSIFITWHAVSRKHEFDYGTDTFVIRDEKIIRQSIAYTLPRAKT